MYTLKQIAGVLRKPESTLRRWREIHGQFIPSTGSGRGKKYPETAMAVWRFVAECYDRHETATETQDKLSQKFPMVVDLYKVEPPPETTAAPPPDRHGDRHGNPELPIRITVDPAVLDRVDRFLDLFEKWVERPKEEGFLFWVFKLMKK